MQDQSFVFVISEDGELVCLPFNSQDGRRAVPANTMAKHGDLISIGRVADNGRHKVVSGELIRNRGVISYVQVGPQSPQTVAAYIQDRREDYRHVKVEPPLVAAEAVTVFIDVSSTPPVVRGLMLLPKGSEREIINALGNEGKQQLVRQLLISGDFARRTTKHDYLIEPSWTNFSRGLREMTEIQRHIFMARNSDQWRLYLTPEGDVIESHRFDPIIPLIVKNFDPGFKLGGSRESSLKYLMAVLETHKERLSAAVKYPTLPD